VSRVGGHSLRKNANYHSDICTANRASCSHFWHTHGTRFTEARMSARHQCEASAVILVVNGQFSDFYTQQ